MGAGEWIKQRVARLVDDRLDPEIEERSLALAVRQNEYGYDQFGFHRSHFKYALAGARWLYRSYFRAEAFGTENIPQTGRVLFIANHSGQLPFDGVVIAASLFLEPATPRLARSMVETYVPSLPFASFLFNRWGQITGTPENCRRLLEDDEAILVFPEGARGISKPFSQRYQLAHFGLGFMRLALETNTPIVPIAVIGAEEQAPGINLKRVAKLVGAPAFPIVPYPPFVPVVPLPVKYRLYYGEPMVFEGDADDDDEVLIEKVRAVRHRIQTMVHIGLRARRRVFW